MTDEGQVRRWSTPPSTQFGRLDILVANAGIVRSGPVDEMNLARLAAGAWTST